MKNKALIVGLFLIPFVILAILLFSQKSDPEKNVQEPLNINQQTKPTMTSEKISKPEMIIDKTKDYKAVLKTSKGEITIDLNEAETPITVNNFVYLGQNDFYNNTIFHRVIKGFMIQGGDPKDNGTGGPGYQFDDEPFDGEYTRGTVAMANSGPNTNGSQFFIMHQDYNLPKNYVIFGKVSKGMEVVDKIAESETKPSSTGEDSVPLNPTEIESVEVIEK